MGLATIRKVAEAKLLIDNGEKVYRACNQVGLDLGTWYRHRSGHALIDLQLKLKRLQKKNTKLTAQLQKVQDEMAKVQVEILALQGSL